MHPECDCRGVKHLDEQGRFVKCDDCGMTAQYFEKGPTLWVNTRAAQVTSDGTVKTSSTV